MKIKYAGKTYTGTRDRQTGAISIKNGKVFAGFGERNMVRGFRIVDTKKAPKKAQKHEKAD